MSRKRLQEIERHEGSGILEATGTHVSVDYQVVVSAQEVEGMPDQWIAHPHKDYQARVEASDAISLMAVAHQDDTAATLHMENGWHFDCRLSAVRNASGRLTPRTGRAGGPLYRA